MKRLVGEIKIIETIHILKKYFYVIRAIIRNNIASQMQYRTSMALRFAGAAVELGVSLLFFEFLYHKVRFIKGWAYPEILILICTYDIVRNVLLGCFVRNLPKIEDMILDGSMDQHFTKPVDAQFYISFRQLSLGHLFQVIVPLGVMIYAMHLQTSVALSVGKILLYVLSLCCGIVIGYSLWIMLMSLSFYCTKVKSLHEIYLDLMCVGRYPSNIYPAALKLMLRSVLPILMLVNLPVEIFLGFEQSTAIWGLIFTAFVTLALSRAVWRQSIKSYISAGG